MTSLKFGKIVGKGALGVLAAGLVISSVLQTGQDWIFGLAIVIFVMAGATSLIIRSLKK